MGQSPTAGSAPPGAHAFFDDATAAAEEYARLLAGPGVERGLIGPREVPRLWDRHLINCAVIAPAVPPGAHVLDVGSGAGLPGIPLAIARPDVSVVLVEPLLRRVTFLSEVVDRLGLSNVTVHRGRAQEWDSSDSPGVKTLPDVVTARAVAPLDRLAAMCLPLLSGGWLLALKGSRAEEELAAAETSLRSSGADRWFVRDYGAEYTATPTRVIHIHKPTGGRVVRAT